MSIRACVCIGVGEYCDEGFQSLPGARVDAKRVFETLTDPNVGQFDPDASFLLIDPNKQDALKTIGDALYGSQVETFTIFFAGHGGSKHESYSLCCSDTETDRFALTALSVGEIFRLINDARPNHSNIVIDACHATGMLSDFGSLLKPTFLGPANSSSVSILAMSASDRYANETAEGGVGTTAFLRCLNGEIDVPVRKQYLSLEDVGAAIAPYLGDQTPSTWSFNLSGASRLSKNPFFSAEETSSPYAMPDFGQSETGALSKEHAALIWREYVSVSDVVNPRRLQDQLMTVLENVPEPENQADILLGLFESFSARAAEAEDGFAVVEVHSVFLFATAAITEDAIKSKVQRYLIAELDKSVEAAAKLFHSCASEEHAFVAKGSAFSEFFALPIRVSKVAAWSLCSVYLAANDEPLRDERIERAKSVCEQLKLRYSPSFSLMSEDQASYIHVISELAASYGMSEWSEEYISTLYADYFYVGRRVAKSGISPKDVFDFLRYRISHEPLDYKRFSAKPSELLVILLHHFVSSGRSEVIKYDFVELDKTNLSTFVPHTYRNFSEEVVTEGTNVGLTIGFDIFTIFEFQKFVTDHVLPKATDALSRGSQQDAVIALIASLIYPNRISWFLSVSREGPPR